MIDNLVYLLEITDLDHIDLNDSQLCKVGIHLINHLRDNHEVPGRVYNQILGICQWYKEHHTLTDKQRTWMTYNLKEYISQRDFMYEV